MTIPAGYHCEVIGHFVPGRELIAINVRALDAVASDGARPKVLVLARCDITIVPSLNPDGRASSLESLSAPGMVRFSSRGNAKDHWTPLSGTRSPRSSRPATAPWR